MKGIIAYSSQTGNTKKLAQDLYQGLKDLEGIAIDLEEIGDQTKLEDYDFALLGGWIDRAMPDKKSLKIIKNTGQKNLGLFVTLGAKPDSEHGLKVEKNLERLLEGKNSLGRQVLPGKVDPKAIKSLQGLKASFIPKAIREKMVKTGLESRAATEAESQAAVDYFKKKLIEWQENKKK